MQPVEAYLAELRDLRASGAAVPETSGYGSLTTLLTEVGGKLKPKVRCLINLQNAGAGIPDGGLFTASQFPKGGGELLALRPCPCLEVHDRRLPSPGRHIRMASVVR